ncbi:SDR family oxidoreductase [Oceanibium sediminis]|uniref:SDR family oxidoreductase n=1 Tax=Oceanibium sediminis TaxID=2026339 RepID=UPI000DD362DA|nr:SDR family oxidoreductase [Oceanibium sediminis]
MSQKTAPEYVPGHGLLKDKSVLITAAAGKGIGFATARRAVEEGARALMIADIHERRLQEAQAELQAIAPEIPVLAEMCDVTVEEQVQALVASADKKLSGIDVLVNNAGLGGLKPVVEMSDEEWLKVLDVTLNGTFRMTRAALARMMPRGKGAIVNNASVLGWRAQKGQAHYAAAKAGVMALTRCSGLEAADHGIRINAVAPSIAMHEFLAKSAPAEVLEKLAGQEAFGRAAEVWEVANVIMFLASDYSSYMVGEVLSVSSQRA